ncbi:MAG TPA: DUF58 domain-containing protein, partial [Chloroflexota bacterium]|nr:DUF58 domain-containing protein [Chloroflexota bacterium]
MKLPALPVLGILPPRWRRRRATPAGTAGTISPPGEAERLLRRLDFTVIRQLDGLRQGEHRNAALGFGLDLAELRPYQPGDDVRALDWNVTARMGEAYVRRYHEDRDVTAWLLLDLTASTDFGSARQTKRDLLLDVAGTLARLLTSRGDRVGALLYTGSARRRRTRQYAAAERRHSWRMGLQRVDERTERLPAELVASGAGRVHVLQLLRRALDASRRGAPRLPAFMGPSRGHETDLASLLEQGFRTAHQRSLIFLLSDFLDGGPPDGGSSGFRVPGSESRA